MTAIVGFAMLIVVIGLLLTRRLSPLVAFSVIPVVAGLLLGYGPKTLGEMMSEGVETVAPMVALFIFAILYFGLMRDRGLFEPVVRVAVRVIAGKPIRLALVTVLLAALAHLDGAGATTFLLTIPTLLPIYDRLGVRRVVLLMLVGVSAGLMNMVPWGGTTLRAAAALNLEPGDIWRPLIPVQLFGLAVAVCFAIIIGMHESRRIARQRTLVASAATAGGRSEAMNAGSLVITGPDDGPDTSGHLSARDWRFWANIVLTVSLLALLFSGLVPLELCFIVAFGLALLINYRRQSDQDASIRANAAEALYMGAVLLAVGIFLGILNGTGMMTAITDVLTGALPQNSAQWVPIFVGALAAPLDLVLGADPFAFGLLPVVDHVAATGGVDSMSVARAALIGQNAAFSISPMTPSVYLAVGLAGVPLGRHIKFTLPWVWVSGLLMLGFALAIGVVSI